MNHLHCISVYVENKYCKDKCWIGLILKIYKVLTFYLKILLHQAKHEITSHFLDIFQIINYEKFNVNQECYFIFDISTKISISNHRKII